MDNLAQELYDIIEHNVKKIYEYCYEDKELKQFCNKLNWVIMLYAANRLLHIEEIDKDFIIETLSQTLDEALIVSEEKIH